MLRHLEIENYGLIARAGVAFAEGATIFTGETGSGKTMLLGALGFVLGARAAADCVRRGASKASVTLTFDPNETLRERLGAGGFELDPGEEASIEREMNDNGRSSVRVNGRTATAAYLREIGDAIAEIVGQHEHQRLLAPASHAEMLDRFAGSAAHLQRANVAQAHARCDELAHRLAQLRDDESTAREAYEQARQALEEIEAAAIRPQEDTALAQRRRVLENAERIGAALRAAGDALAGEDAGATGALGAAGVALASVAELSADLREMAGAAAALQSEANDLAARLARALDAAEYNAGELDAVGARLDVLDRLKRRHGGSLERVLETAAAARATVDEYERRDERTAEAAAAASAAQRELVAAAVGLTELRRAAAVTLARAVEAELPDLALASARFAVEATPLERIGPEGAERMEFAFAANAGEPLRPLSRVASGGELSRLLLALVVVLQGARGNDALVFDEIDAGIGGATAAAVGARIGRLAGGGQVICVTHSAQLATWAQRHYVLDKSERDGETAIALREVRGAAERETEIARMLSGEPHEAALRHARALLAARGGSADLVDL